MTLTWQQKLLVYGLSILLLLSASFIIYQQYQMSKKQDAIEKSAILQKELLDGVMRSQSQYATSEDIKNSAKELGINLKTIQEDIDKLHAKITALNVVTVVSGGYVGNNIPSNYYIPRTDSSTSTVAISSTCSLTCLQDPFGYMTRSPVLTLNEKFGQQTVPFGNVSFSAWQQNPWALTVHERAYQVSTIIGTDENQRIVAYNTFNVTVNGNKYPIRIEKANLQQVYPEVKFRFDPRLYLDVFAGVTLQEPRFNATPALSMGFLTLGQYREKPDFVFLKLGIGYGLGSGKAEFTIVPAAYNVGQHIPFTSGNIFVAPAFQVNTSGQMTLSANAGLKF